ncbi:MAG: prolyl oligopeptidase family serine peptidase [Nocardioidaceae bacterium]
MAPDDRSQSTSFPRLAARTLRFTLGIPRNASVVADGRRVLFVRTPSGTSRNGALWAYDLDLGAERLVADPETLLGDAGEQLSTQERARRERARESAAGIVSYSTDRAGSVAAFALSGKVWVADVISGGARQLSSRGAAIDPRVDPNGRLVAYAADGALRVVSVTGNEERALVEPDGAEVVWGQAEFVAAEEMERFRGFWWAPDGQSLLVERYDNSPVQVWYIADPANPAREPAAHRYPQAGTANADVSLWHVRLDGSRTEIAWDHEGFPYLTRVSWTSDGAPLVQVMSRDQRHAQTFAVDPVSEVTRVVRDQHDDVWVDLVNGIPAYAPGGRLVTAEDDADTKRVFVDGIPISPVGWQVREVLGVDQFGVLLLASQEPTEVQVVHVGYDGTTRPWTGGPAVHRPADFDGGTLVVTKASLDTDGVRVSIWRGGAEVAVLGNHAEHPGFRPQVHAMAAGERGLRTAVLFPRGHVLGSRRLPVLMDPYGGPHAQRVMASSRLFLESQWLADQGFCVVVADGRGTPARGPAWDRSIRDDLLAITLQDQVDALAAVAAHFPADLDLGRVGITGWSYGGYLAAGAVLLRPDVFHAAVAGAPVTDLRLYDTFYNERYLGHPGERPEVYEHNSLLPLAGRLSRPLMIIHGLVDDNVFVAHTLQLSSALLAAGRPHTVLPLTGVTHMASQEEVAENIKLFQVDFLRRSLGV